jgi:hypothetical protein
MSAIWVTLWFRAFVATLVVEAVVAIPMLGRAHGWARRGGALVLVNLATHPIVWFVIPVLTRRSLSWTQSVVVSEAWAIGAETVAYRLIFPDLSWKRCLAISALANLASTAIGLGLRALGVRL